MDSQYFVRIKVKACGEVGIVSFVEELPEDYKETDVLRVVSSFNENPSVHGIIMQLPLPQGNHCLLLVPPKGCVELLLQYGVELIGKKAVVIGRSVSFLVYASEHNGRSCQMLGLSARV
ncbi:unnamed protein product [Fraxinus pennsylvanica]|uniref:Tetrahydrofolate dehydrogenase/cyclohydrolase catalytic domain-containing protein n=1 Tax=Fraxinus pennsylvanica TaxID=56036 RepID=A0AAD1Z049_9LAMI|nr:unnamed protein product [Fraxinus pennsylvanica]